MHVGIGGGLLDLRGEPAQPFTVEFVIAQHVNDGSVRDVFRKPVQSLSADAYVSCNDRHVCCDRRHTKRRTLQVQIAYDVESHSNKHKTAGVPRFSGPRAIHSDRHAPEEKLPPRIPRRLKCIEGGRYEVGAATMTSFALYA